MPKLGVPYPCSPPMCCDRSAGFTSAPGGSCRRCSAANTTRRSRARGCRSRRFASTSPATMCGPSTGTSPPARATRLSSGTSRSANSRCSLVVDVSASQRFGTGLLTKRAAAAELAALLALCAVSNNDRVGLVAFSSEVERFVPPNKGPRHVLRLLRDILAFEPQKTGHRSGRGAGLRGEGPAAAGDRVRDRRLPRHRLRESLPPGGPQARPDRSPHLRPARTRMARGRPRAARATPKPAKNC